LADEEHEEAAPREFLAGLACTDLIAFPKSWIKRRVETIEMLSHEETRRRVSIDFVLGDERLRALRLEDGVAVPISVLTKEPRRHFDLRDEAGRSVPVLGRQQNGELAHMALVNAALDALPEDLTRDDFEPLAAQLREIVFGDPDDARDVLGSIVALAESGDRRCRAIVEDEMCQALLFTLWRNYVLFAVLPPDGPNRRVLKYAYAEDFAFDMAYPRRRDRWAPSELRQRASRPDRKRFVIECAGAWRAESFHAEIAVPEELRIDFAVLSDFATAPMLSTVDTDINRAALYASDGLREEQQVAAYVEVSPERAGRTSQAATTSLIVAALLWLGVRSGLDAKNPGAAISLLLAGAAVFTGFSAAQGQHRLVRRAFAASRRWLGVVTLAALTASASLAMEYPKAHPVAVWRVAAVACTIAAVRLCWSAVRAPS
jgi:hypothetical protein